MPLPLDLTPHTLINISLSVPVVSSYAAVITHVRLYSVIIMDEQNCETSRPPIPMTSHSSTVALIDLPLDIILYMAKFLSFEDYKSFVRSLWPDNNECESVRRKLWELSTHKIRVKFINGKELDIEYNYDISRPKVDHILLNWDYLLPMFARVQAPPQYLSIDRFVNFTRLQNFIACHMHMDRCSDDQHASCHCHRVETNVPARVMSVRPKETECYRKHFQHYCYQHLGYWFDFYLKNTILNREKGQFFDEETANQFLRMLRNTVCL